jgi:cysteine-S-conjugate beta-lyase
MSGGDGLEDMGDGTRLVTAGRRPEWTQGLVNPAVWRGSTCLFDDVAALDAAVRDPDAQLYYGRRGTPTSWALADALTSLEPGAAGTKLYPSGTAAIFGALIAVLQPGDHLLMVDSAYEPTRAITRGLTRLGIESDYYDPMIGAGIDALVKPNTRAVFLESPGSLSFEVQDVPAIVRVARARGLVTLLDNTWATPLYFPAIAAGIDLSIVAATKYIVGHSDVMMGSVTSAPATWEALRRGYVLQGQCVSPDDAYLAARGLRTMQVRLAQHDAAARKVAAWLAAQPQVGRVLHPAFPDCPGHAFWRRDFTGASGLFAFTFRQGARAHAAAFIDALRLFGIGFSWGGFESLALPIDPTPLRTATRWNARGPAVRLHIGLEDVDDLIADLAHGLARYDEALAGR